MDYKIGIMLESLRLPFDEAIATAANIGADMLQISAISPEFSPLEMNLFERREVLKKIKDVGMAVSAVCGDLGGHGFTRLTDNFQKIETSKRIVELASDFETSIITTHIGVIPSERTHTYEVLLEACTALGEYAAKQGAKFAIETGPETPEVLDTFLNEASTPGLAVNYDPANLVMVTGSDPIKGVHTLADKIVHAHAKDGVMIKKTDPQIIYDYFAEGGIGDIRMSDYFAELPLGKGDVDIAAWVKALVEVGYTGAITIEREVGESPVDDILLAVNYLRRIFGTVKQT